MNTKGVMFGLFVGSTIGGVIPAMFGASIFSMSSLIFSAIGGLAGAYIVYRVMND